MNKFVCVLVSDKYTEREYTFEASQTTDILNLLKWCIEEQKDFLLDYTDEKPCVMSVEDEDFKATFNL